ncbi:hypothetical protein REC12_25285 [Desulfosporosinus sp. PR]|uniref:hypothetical protein n=1 Tax=Candidatus Desulfosporosinus nitrosoreducens TaxID=3401928 RepID=UPI0027F9FBA3|nr:hypothetical protein [Desulfosporosinus sp. PR]MDQ7096913.1 hypothetical protein [Desulfosporosinus sp. PR]
MNRKRVFRTIISVALLGALVAVIIVSQNHDPSNPHSTIPKDTWINGPHGHGYAVMNNQQPWKQCYPCHEKKGLGGEEFCQSCHTKSNVKVTLPKKPS